MAVLSDRNFTLDKFWPHFTGRKMAINWIEGNKDDNICCKKKYIYIYSLVMFNPTDS